MNPVRKKERGEKEATTGKGTAIIVDKRIGHQPCRERYNDDKRILHIISYKEIGKKGRKNIIIGGIHAENGNSKRK